jgi:hypothetical protein
VQKESQGLLALSGVGLAVIAGLALLRKRQAVLAADQQAVADINAGIKPASRKQALRTGAAVAGQTVVGAAPSIAAFGAAQKALQMGGIAPTSFLGKFFAPLAIGEAGLGLAHGVVDPRVANSLQREYGEESRQHVLAPALNPFKGMRQAGAVLTHNPRLAYAAAKDVLTPIKGTARLEKEREALERRGQFNAVTSWFSGAGEGLVDLPGRALRGDLLFNLIKRVKQP